MTVKQAMKLEASANKDITLTKAAQIIFEGDRKVVDKSLNNYKPNEWLGLAQNPLLTPEDMKKIFTELDDAYNREKLEKVKANVKTRNMGIRGKIRKLISLHQNLSTELIDMMINGSRLGTPTVLNNPNVKKSQLDLYFKNHIMTTAQGSGYNFVSFNKLMETKNITSQIALEWYKQLKPYADWNYQDNQWYAIVAAFLEFDDCPKEILKDIVSVPINDSKTSWLERNREQAINHKNADKDDFETIAFRITNDEKYMPASVKEVFIF